jgi:membrane protein YqaA with SNARE-associated domain
MTEQLLGTLGLYGGTLVVCFVSGLVPLINTELFLVGLGVVAITSPGQIVPIAVLAAIGQVSAHLVLYFAGLGVVGLPRGKTRDKIERARARVAKWQRRPHFVLALAATIGIPPLMLVSVVAGAMKISVRAYCLISLVGRTVRFAAILAIPFLA